MKNKKITIKYILYTALIVFVFGCNGDIFNRYKVTRDASDNPANPDTEAPKIVSAAAPDKDKLVVVFDEEVDESTALDYTNYHIQGNNRVNVLDNPAPVLGDDNTTVTVTLSTGLLYGMQNGREYTLLIQGVGDTSGNTILNEFAYFEGRGPVVAEIWRDGTQMPDEYPYPSINSGTAEFEVRISGADDGSYSYSADGSAFSGVINLDEPILLSGLSEGFHSLKVIGQNALTGEWQEAGQATSTEFIVDTIPPVAVLSHTPPNVTDSGDIAVIVGGDGVETYTYRINSGDWSDYLSAGTAITETDLGEATYTLYVRGRDAAWNEQTGYTTATWKVSTTTPVAVISNCPPRYTRLRIASFAISGNSVYYYKFKINNDQWSDYIPVNQEITLEDLSDGDYTLYVVGATKPDDPSLEGETVEYAWTVDNVPPECVISNLPLNPTNSQKTNIVVSTEDRVAAYKYRLITGGIPGSLSGVYPVSMPVELTALNENTYTIKVIGIDAAGNTQTEDTAAEWTWTVDITPPRASLSGTPEVATNNNSLSVTVGPSSEVAYKYLLDGGQWSSETPVSVLIQRSNITDGYHTLSAVARDLAGNWQSFQDPTEFVWQIDTVPPVVTLSNTPASITNLHTANFAIGGAGVAEYRYRLNTGEWSAWRNRVEYPTIYLESLTDDDYTLEVSGRDLAYNEQTTPTSFAWTVNSSTPTAVLTGTPAQFTIIDSINITVNGVDNYMYKFDADDWSLVTAETTPIVISGISNGPHYILVIGENAGQWQDVANPTRWDWTVDTIDPMAQLTDKPSNPTSSQSAAIRVTGVGVYSYKASLDDPNPSGSPDEILLTTDDTINLENLDAGNHTIYVIARDEAGNWQDDSAATTYTWQIDTSVPSAVFAPASLPDDPTSSGSMAVTVGGSGVVSYKYKIDGAASWSGELDIAVQITRTGLTAGPHTVYAIGKNITGTWQSDSSPTDYTWVIDFTAPTASDIILSNLPNDPTEYDFIDITVGGSAIEYYQFKINNEAWSADIPVGTDIERSGMVDMTYTLYVIGRDAAGNWTPRTSAKTYTWEIDTANTVAAITNRPDNPTNIDSAEFIIMGTGVIEYRYSLDGGLWSGWTSTSVHIILSDLDDGSHTIEVCGRKSSTPPEFEQLEEDATVYSWTVDTAAPTAVMGNLPADPTTATTINITVGGTGVTAYRYRLDGGAWIPALSELIAEFPISISGLSFDAHTIEVMGRDQAGNWQASPSSHSWTITPPALASPETSDVGDNTTSALLTFSWVRPYGTADVKIQVASDSGFSDIEFESVIGNIDSYGFTVTDAEEQRYYARVSVNESSGMPLNDPSWENWGTASNGIWVTGGIAGTVYHAISRTGLSDATVEIWSESPSQLISSGETDENGDFAFNNIPIGITYYEVRASMATYIGGSTYNVTVALGNETNVGIMYMVPVGLTNATITGTTVDANDGTLLTGTNVYVYNWQNTLADTQPTNGSGVFTTISLPAGIYSILFSRTGYYDLRVDNIVVNGNDGNENIERQAICAHLVEPQVRVITLWGYYPRDLDMHLVGPTSKTISSGDPDGATNRFHVGYVGGYHYNYNEATGTYETATPDRDGTSSTAALVQDDVSGYGPEAINLWRYGGVQYARGIYTYTIRNYSETNWYQSATNIIVRVYDSQGMRQQIIMPTGADDPADTTRDWKALKITVQGNSRAMRPIYVPSQNIYFNAGSDNSKAGFDW